MKTNIKMRVTPEQSKKVQEIVFANNGGWRSYVFQEVSNTGFQFLYINEEKEIMCGDDTNLFKKDEFKEIDTDLFISTNGTCEETEENKMEWIEYNGQELEEEKLYLFCWYDKEMCVVKISKGDMQNFKDNFSGRITAYMELPKPYEKPKSLKERLDEAVEKYCYEFSDEELKDGECAKCHIAYGYKTNRFFTDLHYLINNFTKYNFKEIEDGQDFIDSFTTDELMKIMKGEVK